MRIMAGSRAFHHDKGEFQLPTVMDYMMDWTVSPGTCFLVNSLSLVSRVAPRLTAERAEDFSGTGYGIFANSSV
ncbi:hypothetical protein ACYULU_04830 [Breznakiellaceae bacterium SP9]